MKRAARGSARGPLGGGGRTMSPLGAVPAPGALPATLTLAPCVARSPYLQRGG